MEQVEQKRFRITLAVVAAVVVFVLFVPLPYRVFCSLDVEARDAKTVYVEVPGTLKAVYVHPGEHVKKGKVLAELENYDLEVSIAELRGRRDQLQSQLDSLMRERFRDTQAGGEVPRVQESLDAIEEQLSKKAGRLAHLQLVAPADGWIIPTPEVPAAAGRRRQSASRSFRPGRARRWTPKISARRSSRARRFARSAIRSRCRRRW